MRGELTIAAFSRRGQRHLDHFEPEARGVRIVDRTVLAAGQLLRRAHARRPGHIDIDVVLVVRIGDHRVRVRAAAGLHVGDVLRAGDVGDVEDADAAQPILAHRLGHALDAAVERGPSVLRPTRTAGSCRPRRRSATPGRRRSSPAPASTGFDDVEDLEAVVVALDRVLAGERQIGVGHAEELLARRRRRDQPQVPRRLCGIPAAGAPGRRADRGSAPSPRRSA